MRGTVKISRPVAEVAFALLLLAIGIHAQRQGVSFGLGTVNRPGSGAMPLIVGILLCATALWIAVGARSVRGQTVGFDLRGLVFVGLAVAAWIWASAHLGLLPAIWLLCFIGALAYAWSGLWATVITAAAMSVIAKLLFIDLLSVRLPLFRF